MTISKRLGVSKLWTQKQSSTMSEKSNRVLSPKREQNITPHLNSAMKCGATCNKVPHANEADLSSIWVWQISSHPISQSGNSSRGDVQQKFASMPQLVQLERLSRWRDKTRCPTKESMRAVGEGTWDRRVPADDTSRDFS